MFRQRGSNFGNVFFFFLFFFFGGGVGGGGVGGAVVFLVDQGREDPSSARLLCDFSGDPDQYC